MAVYKEDKDCSQYQCPIKGYPVRNDDEAQGQHPNDATDSVQAEPSKEDQFNPKTDRGVGKKPDCNEVGNKTDQK
jgi:hypothetical protein